ncbi:hypothetical protein C1A50_3755 [Paenibacillus polymyxa]|nr:hypothetical protein C1A50_3755 [Paenibacillus polymyxa]
MNNLANKSKIEAERLRVSRSAFIWHEALYFSQGLDLLLKRMYIT